MKIKPTATRRNVFLDIETITQDQSDPKGALSGLTGQVVCICALIDDGRQITEHTLIERDESSLLRSFWSLVRDGDVFIGHNVLGFDLPFLRQRSWIRDIRPSRRIDLRRFYSADVLDTQQIFSNWGATKFPGLDSLATALGCGSKSGHGCDVAEWWAKGDLKEIADYCRQDVWITLKVFNRLMFLPIPERFAVLESAPKQVNQEAPTTAESV
jgi:3'-5' exonuclease